MKILCRFLTGACLLMSAAEAQEKAKPNIVVILADDMCYNALSYTGSEVVETPNIDRICKEGLFCPQGYVTHGVCAPSRAGLITGRYQARFGYETLSGPNDHAIAVRHGVATNELTMAQMLKGQGYATAAYGKWHLGQCHEFLPLQRGFDHHFGYHGGGGPYFKPKNPDANPLMYDGKQIAWPEGGKWSKGAYQPDFLTDDAIEWMRKVAPKQPFFVYFAPFSVHSPFHAPKELYTKEQHAMVGMMKALDINVGHLLKALETMGEMENTIIVFLNDNGGIQSLEEDGFSNKPYRAGKARLYEGGVRVPFALWWPGKIEGGEYPGVVSSLDLMPTFAAVAGATLPGDRDYDGINLLPMLTGKADPVMDRTLCWRWRNGYGVRKGKWKLVWMRDFGVYGQALKEQGIEFKWTDRPNPEDRYNGFFLKPELYDLEADPSETTDLAEQYPEVLERLKTETKAFDAITKAGTPSDKASWPKPLEK